MTRMKKYYVLGAKNGMAQILNIPIEENGQVFLEQEFADISFIDALFSLNYFEEEARFLLKKYNYAFLEYDDFDVFIGRVTFNEKKKSYSIRFYDPIYKTSSLRVAPKIESNLQKEALKRMECIQNKEKILLPLDSTFKEFLNLLLSRATGSPDTKHFILRADSIVDPEIKKNIRGYYRNTDYLVYRKLESDMQSYKKLRGFCLEFLQSNSLTPINFKERNIYRKGYLYPSKLFDFDSDFTVSIDEVNLIPRNYVPPLSNEEQMALEEAKIWNYIYHQSFSNQEMQDYYEQGGLEAIFANMDANDIYGSLTDEDKAKLNLLSIEQYIEKNRQKFLHDTNHKKSK